MRNALIAVWVAVIIMAFVIRDHSQANLATAAEVAEIRQLVNTTNQIQVDQLRREIGDRLQDVSPQELINSGIWPADLGALELDKHGQIIKQEN